MLSEGHQIPVDGLTPPLRAYAAIKQLSDASGGTRNRVDQRGRLRYDHAWIRLSTPPPAIVTTTALPERDLRWLAETDKPRRGRRARELADRAVRSGLFRALYELDMSGGHTQLGHFLHVEARVDVRPALDAWLTNADDASARMISRLVDAVPLSAKAWARQEASRLIAAVAATTQEREVLVDQLCLLARALPAAGAALTVIASRTTRRTHGLDPGTTVGRLGVRLAAAIAGHPPPTEAAAAREAWAAVGVWVDPLASQVAGWRLPINPKHPAAAVVAGYSDANQPAVLTLGIITASRSTPLVSRAPDDHATLWVVEGNSALTMIAAQNIHAPVLCRGGTPSVAVTRLITEAAAAGWRIAVSSDFEPGGLRGAITVLRCAGTAGVPWRLTTSDYLNAPAEGDPFAPNDVPETPWDPDLAAAMRKRHERASEEDRLPILLADLTRHTNRTER